MQTITAAEVVAACKRALVDETLLALHPEATGGFNRSTCVYKAGEYRCAIGVALSAETLDVIVKKNLNSEYLGKLVKLGVVSIDPADDHFLRRLQMYHDAWLQASTEEDRQTERASFERALNDFTP